MKSLFIFPVFAVISFVGPSYAHAGLFGRLCKRSPQVITYAPVCSEQAESAAPASYDGEWRAVMEDITVQKRLSDGSIVQETRTIEKQQFFSNKQLLDELRKQVDEKIQKLDRNKAEVSEVQKALDKKADKPANN